MEPQFAKAEVDVEGVVKSKINTNLKAAYSPSKVKCRVRRGY
jgi:hypothetical protein